MWLGLSYNMWLYICLAITVIGFLVFKFGQNLQKKGNSNGTMVSLIAWLILIVGVMGAWTFFRGLYLK